MAVMTVNGAIPCSSLGITSPHEHAYIDIRNQYKESDVFRSSGHDIKVNADLLPHLMVNPYCVRDNLVLDDENQCVFEMGLAAAAGLKTFVDATPCHIGRDPLILKRLSERTGLNIVAGCGYYTSDTHPECVRTFNEHALADNIINEIHNGIDDTGIKPGIIGEIGTSRDIGPDESKVLRAAAAANRATGAPVMVHLYPWGRSGLDVLDILEESGTDLERVCLCHTDVALDLPYMLKLLERGAFLEFDNFGKEFKSDAAYGNFPTDDERLGILYKLVDAGFGKMLLASCDICLKVLYKTNGGVGYAHLLTTIAAKIREQREDAEQILFDLLSANPARYLDNPMLD